MEKIVIVGAGGLGKEVAFLVRRIEEYQLIGFIDEAVEKKGQTIVGLPVVGDLSYLQKVKYPLAVVLAIADGEQRARLVETLRTNLHLSFPTIQDPSALIGFNVTMGEGNIVMPQVTLTGDIQIQKFNIINLKCAIGHDVQLGSYNTLFPNCLLAGYVGINNYAALGMGTQVIQNTQIANYVITGAGTVVIRDLKAKSKVVGVPARALHTSNEPPVIPDTLENEKHTYNQTNTGRGEEKR
ncbi:acetyltransferase [Enterococcus ureasiticus]|uniref:PglD N-terminal domain-containing protein n=1 Tax=Enterococcus ureasiticus TaxID=903984 RepID=A0A1E5GGW5_9ENTE|nr:acetyltransferase [Enterococcus ureasiticus]OEG11966.1 hypothetical protein BCR21_06945 [Enterococcus ureasiticus]